MGKSSFLNFFNVFIVKKWFGSVDGFIVVYSVGSTRSFDSIQNFLEGIKKIRKTNRFPMIIVGTQGNFVFVVFNDISADLPEQSHLVTEKEGRSVAYRYRCPFIEVSAKTGKNVDKMFQSVVREIRQYKIEQWQQDQLDAQYRAQKKKRDRVPFSFLLFFTYFSLLSLSNSWL